MSFRFLLTLILTFTFGIGPLVRAELTWKTTAFEGRLAAGETELTTRFEFKNTGKVPVRITDIRSTCGCATGTADHPVYPPDKEGVITVHFASQGAVGPQHRHLFITTDEDRREPYALALRIDIAEWFTVIPRVMSWDRGATPSAQSARLTLAPEARAKIMGITSATPGFEARIIPEEKPGAHRIEITPNDTSEASRAVFSVTVRLPSGHDETKTIHVRVR
jgi:hypothetical protein